MKQESEGKISTHKLTLDISKLPCVKGHDLSQYVMGAPQSGFQAIIGVMCRRCGSVLLFANVRGLENL
jgi:hypothetical protein